LKNKTYILIFLLLISVSFFAGVCSASASPGVKSLFKQGSTAYHAGNFQEALIKWKDGLTLAEQGGNKTYIRAFAANIGLAYAGLSEYEKALTFYEKALKINREIDDKKNAAINMNNIGVVYKDLGHYDKALEYYKEALAIRRDSKDRRSEANIMSNIGVVYSDSARYKDAFKFIKDAMFIYEEIRDHSGKTDALINLGVVYTDVGQYKNALESYQKALEINQMVNDSQKQTNILGNIGAVQILRKDYPDAIDYFQKSLKIQRDSKNLQGAANDLSNLGVVRKRLGELDKALQHYKEALEIKRSLGDKLSEGAILGNLGLVYEELGKYEEALISLSQSHKVSTALNMPEHLWRALRGLGKVEAKLEKNEEAINHYLLALDAIEKMREELAQKEMKTSFMQDKMHVYNELIELLMTLHQKDPKKGYDKKSFNIFERKQGRVFLEEMGKTGVRNFSGIPVEIIDEETQLEVEKQKILSDIEKEFVKSEKDKDYTRIQSLRKKSDTIDSKLLDLREKIKNTYPDYYALKYPKPVELGHLLNDVLEPDEVMLVYGVMDDFTCLWALGKDYFALHRIDSGNDVLTQQVISYRDNHINIFKGQQLRGVAEEHTSTGKPVSKLEFYKTLFPEAISKEINKYSTIYVIPTGPLYLLPFEALKNESNKYLIESHNFAYLSSASLLQVLRETQARKKSEPAYPFLAFANPLYDVPKKSEDTVEEIQLRSFYSLMRGNIAPLPDTEDEVTRIKNILKAPLESKPLQIKENASRSVVFDFNEKGDLDNYKYISFACHGFIPNEVNGIDQPALLLSTPDPVTKEVGLLTMSDVFGLKLNADLVALSACNTGRGKVVKGEGVIGLTRAFMYAGTPAITVNLWSVETVSAQKLSVEYFEMLQQGKNRAQALRDSKLKLISGKEKMYRLPFFWAPMVLFGDGS